MYIHDVALRSRIDSMRNRVDLSVCLRMHHVVAVWEEFCKCRCLDAWIDVHEAFGAVVGVVLTALQCAGWVVVTVAVYFKFAAGEDTCIVIEV